MKNLPKSRITPLSFLIPPVLLMAAVLLTQCKKDKWLENGDPEQFTYLTEEYAPFNYTENGTLTGASVDILEKIFEGLELPLTRSAVTSQDWTTAYDATLSNTGTVLFSTVKNSTRTNLFKWAGPIATQSEAILWRPGSGVTIQEITDLNNYFTGVVAGYSSIDLLMEHGVYRTNIVVYNTAEELYTALLSDHEVQCICFTDIGHNRLIQTGAYSKTDFAVPYPFHTDELFFAFNKNIPDETVAAFQEQLANLKTVELADGKTEYEKILSKYYIPVPGK
jgi:polar amino acid transport system substrate-binding protein